MNHNKMSTSKQQKSDIISTSEALQYCSRQTLYNYAKAGRLTVLKNGSGRNAYLRSELESLFNTYRVCESRQDIVELADELIAKSVREPING